MSSRKKINVMSTADQISIETVKFAIANCTGSIIEATDQQTTVSGSSALGQFLVSLGPTNAYPKFMHFDVDCSQAATATGSYTLQVVQHSASLGQCTVQLLQLSGSTLGSNWTPVTGQSPTEVAKANLTGSLLMVFRNTTRPN